MPGKPQLIALPGFDGTACLFEDFERALPSLFGFHAIAYPAQGALGYVELERIAFDALPTDRPFFLLGESFSGPVALRLAARNPSNLRGLILCASFARSPWHAMRWLSPLIRPLPVHSINPALLSGLLLGRWATPQLLASVRNSLSHVSAPAISARLDAALTVDASSELGTLQLPILYLRGRHDRLFPARTYRHLRECNPGIEFRDVEGPHLLLQTRPEECAHIVADFIARSAPHRDPLA